MRLAILGNSGSGKTTLALRLAQAHAVPVLDLDTVVWEPGKIAVARNPARVREDVLGFCERNPAWIVEGCYAHWIGEVLVYGPELIFLDPGIDVCVENCRTRPWEPHKYASKQEQDSQLAFLLQWVRGYDERTGPLSRKAHEALFGSYHGVKRRIASAGDVPFADPT